MPTNLPPKSMELEKRYREARRLEDKISTLKEYIGSIPEHKGTMKLRAHLRTKLAKLNDELEAEKNRKAGSAGRTPFDIKKTGAAQVVILGLTQSGKSEVLKALTNVKVEVGNRPYTTLRPVVGVMNYKDIQIGIVEAPALMEGASQGKAWTPQVFGLSRNSDGIMLLVSADKNPEAQLGILVNELELAGIYPGKGDSSRVEVEITATGGIKVFCLKNFQGQPNRIGEIAREAGIRNALVRILDETTEEDLRRAMLVNVVHKPFLVVLTKTDLVSAEDVECFKNRVGSRFKTVAISTKTGEGLEDLREEVFGFLDIIRVYPRRPGRLEPDRPVVLRKGAKVANLAAQIHTELQRNFKFAKIWGSSAKYPGEKVGIDFELGDGDVVEVYTG